MAVSDEELAHTATAPGASGEKPAAPALGDTLGRYRLERTLGEGGMGVVHAAFDPDLERRVALKVLRTVDGGGEARQRLLREARAMARLTHANVVTVHEVGTAGDRDYVAMELIDGATLADWLREARPSDEILGAFVAAGRGLAAAHAAGLVHRDFKPHNVLRRRDGRIVVTDFGLARGVEQSAGVGLETTMKLGERAQGSQPSSLSGITATGSVLGTPAYMAPEQWTGGQIGPAADQFAFCVALWEALTGERPFRGDTIEELKSAVKRGAADLDASKLPRRLRRPLRRGLEPEPAKRWPSMDALLSSIVRAERRPLVALAIGGIAIAVGLALFAMMGTRGGSTCEPPAIEPHHVWSSLFAGTTPPELAATLDSQLTKWTLARATACTADASERIAQLHCLDGALARLQVVRSAYLGVLGIHDEDLLVELVDPSICLQPTPPRLGLTASADTIAAFSLVAQNAPEGAHPPVADAQAFADRKKDEPCASAIAMLAVSGRTTEFQAKRVAINEAVATADQCEDERVRADILLASVPYQFEIPMIGPRGEAAIRRAATASDRVAEPFLRARIDFLRAFVAGQHEEWDKALPLAEGVIDTMFQIGLRRRALFMLAEALELYFERGEPQDYRTVRTVIAHYLPLAEQLAKAEGGEYLELAEQLERDDAIARFSLGEVASAHADLVRLYRPSKAEEPKHPIDGTVVDREGKPVGGATVVVGTAITADSIGIFLPIVHRHGDAHLRVTTTDATGTYHFDDAPPDGVILAQLGDRRSHGATIADHLKLVVLPTRRIAGKVALGGKPYTKSNVIVEEFAAPSLHYQLVTPIAADGSFSVDGAPTDKIQAAVVTSNRGMLDQQMTYTVVPASQEAVTNLELSLETTSRTLVVLARSTLDAPLETAQIVIVPGSETFTNVGELIGKNLQGLMAQFAHHVTGERAPREALDKIHPGDLVAQFKNVPAGPITACVIGLSGDMMDPAVQRRLESHLKELEIRCAAVDDAAKVLVVSAPPQKRFD